MALDLSQLRFQVDTTELDRAGKAIGELVTNVGKLDKAAQDAARTEATLARAAKDNAKANLDNAKAQDVRLKSTITADKADQALAASVEKKTKAIEKEAEVTAKSTSILQKQKDILEFQTQGYSKGQSSILAYGKAAGLASAEIEELGKVLETQRKLMGGDPFDKSLSGLKSLQNQYTELKESIRQYNADSDLSSKQTRELARDKERLIEKMKVEGASFSDIRKAVRAHNEDYVKLAGQYNSLMSAEEAVIKNRKEVVAATNYVTQADQKMAAALNQSNAAIDKAGTDSLVRYENALRKSGVSQEVATQKLAAYKVQLEQVQKQELARREQHLTRALAPQATDVVVSLWSGQNPLTVLLQQGGQVTDLFMQSGIAAEKFGEVVKRSMGSMLPSILTVAKGVGGLMVDGFMAAGRAISGFVGQVTFFSAASDKIYAYLSSDGPSIAAQRWAKLSDFLGTTVAFAFAAVTTSIIALGVASIKVAEEQRQLTSVLVMQGGALGLTATSAIELGKSMNAVGITTTDTIAVITEMAKAGNLGKDSITMITEAAVNLQMWGGVAIADTVKTFSSIGKDPVEATIKFAKETGLLTAEQIKLVDELVKTKGKAEGVAEAMKIMATAHKDAAQSMQDQAGFFVRAWEKGLSIISRVKSAILDVDRPTFSEKDIENTKTRLSSVVRDMERYAAMSGTESYGYAKALEQYKDLSAELEKQLRLKKANSQETSTQTEENAKNARGVEYSIELGNKLDDRLKSLTKRQVTLKEYTDEYIAKLREKGKVEGENYEKAKKVAELEWKKAQEKPKSATSTLDIDRTNEIRIIEQSYSRESKVIEKGLNDQLSIAKSKYELGYYTRGQLLAKELELIKNSQKEQKALAEQDLSSREELYVKEVNSILAAYQKRLDANKALKNPEKANAEALADTTLKVQNAYRAWQNFNDIVKDRNKVLDSNLLAKEFEAMKILKDGIKNTTDAIEEFTKVEGLRIKQKNEDNKTEDALRWATPEQAAVIRAVSEETKQYNASLAKLTQSATRAKEILETMEMGFGKDSSQYQDALDNYEKIVQQINQANADHRVNVEKAATDAISKYQKDELKRYGDMLTDVIATTLFEGGKAGSKKLKDYLKTEFKNYVIRVLIQPMVGNLLGNIAGGATGSAASSAGGSALGSLAGSAIGKVTGNFLGGGSFGAMLGNVGAGISTGFSTLFSEGIGAWLSQGTGLIGAGATGGGLGALLGPIGAVALLATLFNKKSTPHMGAASSYSATTGLTSGAGTYATSGFADTRTYNAEVEKITSNVVSSIGKTLDATALAFGKTAGYEISTAFADDSSKDGAWGSLVVKQMGKEVLNWADTQVSKWAPKEFASGEEGVKEYMQAVAISARDALVIALKDVDWAKDMLTALGDNPTLENLGQAVQQINLAKAAIVQFSKNMPIFANLTDSATSAMVKATGSMETLVSMMNSYYENFYTAEEKRANVIRDITATLNAAGAVGITEGKVGSATKDDFRKYYESIVAAEGATSPLAIALLKVSAAFAEITQTTEEAAQALEDSFARENEILRLTGQEVQAVTRERQRELASLDPTNRALQERIYALQDEQSAIEKSKAAAEAAAQAHEKLVAKLTELARTAMQILDNAVKKEKEAAKSTFDALMKDIDSRRNITIKAFEAQKNMLTAAVEGAKNLANVLGAEANRIRGYATGMKLASNPTDMLGGALSAQARLKAGDTSNAILEAATNIDPEMFATWADYATNFFATQGIISDFADKADRQASEAASQVSLLEHQLELTELQHQTDLEHYTKLEEAAKVSLETQIAYYDSILEIANMQLEEALGTKLAVMALGDAMSNFGNAVARLSMATQNEVTSVLPSLSGIPSFDVGTNYVPNDMLAQIHKGEAIVPAAYNPSNPNSNQDLDNKVVDVLIEVKTILSNIQTTTIEQKIATDKLVKLIDETTEGGTGRLPQPA